MKAYCKAVKFVYPTYSPYPNTLYTKHTEKTSADFRQSYYSQQGAVAQLVSKAAIVRANGTYRDDMETMTVEDEHVESVKTSILLYLFGETNREDLYIVPNN